MKEQLLEILAVICEDDVVKEEMDINLFEEGLLDSLGFTELLVEIEEKLGVVIAPSEVEREDMESPKKIIALVEARSGKN